MIVEINNIKRIEDNKYGKSIFVTTHPTVFSPFGGVVDYGRTINLLYPDTEDNYKKLVSAKYNTNEYFEFNEFDFCKGIAKTEMCFINKACVNKFTTQYFDHKYVVERIEKGSSIHVGSADTLEEILNIAVENIKCTCPDYHISETALYNERVILNTQMRLYNEYTIFEGGYKWHIASTK